MNSWSLETDLVTWGLREDPGVVWGPRGRGGARRFSLDPEIVFGARRPLRPYRNPKVSSLDPEIFDWNPDVLKAGNPKVLLQILYIGPEIVWGTLGFLFRSGVCIRTRSSLGSRNILLFAGTVLRLPRQGYYRYLFGFCILPLGSWPLSSSYVVLYFCRKSLTGFRGCWCGCYDPSARLRCFPRLEKQDFDCYLYFTGPRCALGCTGVLHSFDSILRLAHTHSCFMSHTRFDFVDVPLFARVGQDQKSLET
ncbi:hypothetical protein DY000_02052842 [Brassica cretica]|uniref:Uncharacterized protein n=1 Tax=Brassica cretica TaxID=69181 RepID=A0ABQ7AL52_BRACR|nr:hypothetical protein DY000_02052842 [Brassica cretica]